MAVNPTGSDMKAFLAEDPDEPIVMLNLLRFAEGGAERYDAYIAHFRSYAAKVGAQIVYFGARVGADRRRAGQDWDAVLLVRYPSRRAFSDMVRDPGYQEGTHLRTEALTEAVLQPTTPRSTPRANPPHERGAPSSNGIAEGAPRSGLRGGRRGSGGRGGRLALRRAGAQALRHLEPARRTSRRNSSARATKPADAARVALDVLQHAAGPGREADAEDRADVGVGTEVSTPSSKHFTVSSASMNSIRSESSCRSTSWFVAPNCSRSPGQSRGRACRPRTRRSRRRRPARAVELVDHPVDHGVGRVRRPGAAGRLDAACGLLADLARQRERQLVHQLQHRGRVAGLRRRPARSSAGRCPRRASRRPR